MYVCLHRATAGGGLSMEKFADLAAAGGFAGADVDFNFAVTNGTSALGDLYASRKLRFGGWGIPFDWKGPEDKQAEGLAKMSAHAKAAAELKVDSCCTWISSSSDKPFMENWKFHVDRLGPCAKALAEFGLRLGLEYLGPYHIRRARPHEFVFTPGQMLELAAAIGPNVGLLVDSYHTFCSVTPYDHLKKIPAGKIVWVHINDAAPLPVHEQQDGYRLIPGDGIIEIQSFMKVLAETGYSGPASVEIINKDLRKLEPEACAKLVGGKTKAAIPEYF